MRGETRLKESIIRIFKLVSHDFIQFVTFHFMIIGMMTISCISENSIVLNNIPVIIRSSYFTDLFSLTNLSGIILVLMTLIKGIVQTIYMKFDIWDYTPIILITLIFGWNYGKPVLDILLSYYLIGVLLEFCAYIVSRCSYGGKNNEL